MKKAIYILLLLFPTLLFGTPEIKLPKMIITATKYEKKATHIGNTVQIITNKELQQLGFKSVKQALGLFSNISTIESGRKLSVLARGLASHHIKILVDGIETKDPIAPQGGAYLDALSITNIERIEFVQGAKSTIYGTDAVSGVINIITKKNKSYSEVAYGHQHYLGNMGTYTKIGQTNVNLNYGFSTNSSISSLINTTEIDTISKKNIQLNITTPLYGSVIHTSFIQNLANIELDNDVAKIDDPNNTLHTRQELAHIKINLPTIHQIKPNFTYAMSYIHRNDSNKADPLNPNNSSNAIYTGQINESELQCLYLPSTELELIIGAQSKKEIGIQSGYYQSEFGLSNLSMNKSHFTYAYYTQMNHINDIANLSLGYRTGDYSGKTINTYSISIFKHISNIGTTIKTNLQTGYREPGLNEKYGAWGADPNLNAETSKTKELSIEKHHSKNITSIITFFDNQVQNKIDFTTKYINLSDLFKSNGTELSLHINNWSILDFLRLSYTKTNAKWGQKNALRTPKDKYTIATGLTRGKWSLGLSYFMVGKRSGISDSTLASYSLLNAKLQYKVSQSINGYINIANVLNEKYEEVKNYQTPGRMILFGVTIKQPT